MADYNRIVCLDCKSGVELGFKRAHDVAHALAVNAAALIEAQEALDRVEVPDCVECVKSLQVATYCEDGTDVPIAWLKKHLGHRIGELGEMTRPNSALYSEAFCWPWTNP